MCSVMSAAASVAVASFVSVVVTATAFRVLFAMTVMSTAAVAATTVAATIVATASTTFTTQHIDETLDFLIGSIAQGYDCSLEMQGFASQGVVEVNDYGLVFYFKYQSLETVAVCIDQRKNCALIDHVTVEMPIDAEFFFLQLEHVFFFIGSVGFFFCQYEVEGLAYAVTQDLLFKAFKGYAHTGNELIGMFYRGFLYHLVNALFVIDIQLVGYSYVLVGNLFHINKNVC